MAELKINGRTTVRKLRADFKAAFGSTLRVYMSPSCKGRMADGHITLVTMPLRPLKLLRISTGLLYSQYFTPPSRLNIACRYYLVQMRCGHVPLDAHCRTAGSADLHCQEAFLVLRLLLFAFRSLCGNRLNRSRTRHHRNKPSWNQ